MEQREMYAKIYCSLSWLYHELWHTKTLNTSHEANKKIYAGVKKGGGTKKFSTLVLITTIWYTFYLKAPMVKNIPFNKNKKYTVL